MDFKTKITTISILILGLVVSSLLYKSYFGIRVRQKGLEKAFNKQLLKDAGFSSLKKRIFEFVFDLLFFWIIFIYKNGVVANWIHVSLLMLWEKIMFILPISRASLMNIQFLLYSFWAVTIFAAIAAFLAACCCKLKYIGTSILTLIFFIAIWYMNLGICFLYTLLPWNFLSYGCIGYICSIVLYIAILM